jgi:membrane protein DedA with SNARE-associated domain
MRWSRYVPVNALSALVWALAIALAAYWVGPAITDIAADIGLVGWMIVGAAVAIVAAIVLLRRRPTR